MTDAQTDDHQTQHALLVACGTAGLDPRKAELLRLGENALYRLPGNVVARVGRVGQLAAATKEINVAQWLESVEVPAVQAIPEINQPVNVDGRPVTFWRELPPHEHGTPAKVATALKRLHGLELPTTFTLSPIAPFVRLDERIASATILAEEERTWMREHLIELRRRYSNLPAGLPHCVVHGDAWTGNVVSTSDNVLFLDLERTAIGPPEWDLVHTAIKYTSFGWITSEQYREFCDIYGHDVTEWEGFELLRDIREFRMACMAVQIASTNSAYHEQATHRLACLRGSHGPRSWRGWHAVP
jgi:aminoglycoside phosphotransferase (APT) family kinase protein